MRGFTLLELSIVLVIIGLVAGGLLSGRELLEKSKAKGVLAELNNYQQALAAFQEKYKFRPGDLVQTARTFSGAAAVDGNGNSRIDTPSERDVMWPQLYQARMIQDSLTTVGNPASDVRVVGVNRPPSGAGGGWTWVDSYAITVGANTYTFYDVLRLGALDASGANGGEYFTQPILSLNNHRYVDSKIDTENTPLTGKITVGESICAQATGFYATNSDLFCTLNVVEDGSVS